MNELPDICLGFEVHQPYRITGNFREKLAKRRTLRKLFDVYFDGKLDRMVLERVSRKCYLPANEILLEKIDEHKGQNREFKVVFSLSGVLLEQLERWAPDVLDSFRKLVATGNVEVLDQTYHHSLSSLFSEDREEFIEQVMLHRDLMRDLFQVEPTVFENTEFIYNDSVARTLGELGYLGVFTEGADRILGWRSPNHVYESSGGEIKVLLRNYRLADDIAFRFSAVDWAGWPLTADKYADWLSSSTGECIVVFIDYETFGEHQWPETGIHEFLRWLPGEILSRHGVSFKTASEVIQSHAPVGRIYVDDFATVSWADVERSTNAWLGNDMQRTCYRALRNMEPYVKATGAEDALRIWRYLQTSDHLYYMYTEPGASGLVHGYFSSQPPVKAFWTFARVLSNFQDKLARALEEPMRTSARVLRLLPPDLAFHFCEDGRYVNLSAHSLEEFLDAVRLAGDGSILYHAGRGDFERWIREHVGDDLLARQIAGMRTEDPRTTREALCELVKERIDRLKS